MTRYSPDASPDHNRWSWRGDGHGEWWWGHFRDIAATILAAPEFAEVLNDAARQALDCAIEASLADLPETLDHPDHSGRVTEWFERMGDA